MKNYHFVTPSNQKIVLDDQYVFRDILSVEDLKYLFTFKMRLYSMEMFEIVNSKKEMLNYSTKLSDFPENHVFYILHIDIKKSATVDTHIEKESERDERDTKKEKELEVIVEKNTIKEPETVVEVERENVEKIENVENEIEENKENKDILIEKETERDTKKEKEVEVIVEKNTIKEPETVVHFENFENDTKNEKIEEKEKVESKKSCVIS